MSDLSESVSLCISLCIWHQIYANIYSGLSQIKAVYAAYGKTHLLLTGTLQKVPGQINQIYSTPSKQLHFQP